MKKKRDTIINFFKTHFLLSNNNNNNNKNKLAKLILINLKIQNSLYKMHKPFKIQKKMKFNKFNSIKLQNDSYNRKIQTWNKPTGFNQ